MISLVVKVMSGHYRGPGNVGSMGLAKTYPIAPPSTMIGFLDSLCGSGKGELFRAGTNKIAYGYVKPPWGKGVTVRNDQVWASPDIKGLSPEEARIARAACEGSRPTRREVLWGLTYRVDLEGDVEGRVQEFLAGEDYGRGGLWIGESNNVVLSIKESTEPARWLIPDKQGDMVLPTRVPREYAERNSILARFKFSDTLEKFPQWTHEVSQNP